MRAPRLTVHQHLTIEHARREPSAVVVDVMARSGARHWIRLDLGDDADPALDSIWATVWGWIERRTPVTYVRGGAQGVLIDDDEFFRAAFAG